MKTFFDMCSGIGGGRLGLEILGMQSVGYSDTSRLSVTTYKLLHDTTNELNYGNIKRIKPETLPEFDMLIAGFPCQSFSVIGRQSGFNDIRGQIIFYIANVLKTVRPKCFLLENVKGLVTHDKGKTMKIVLDLLEESGYDVRYKVLTSLDYGVPQMRQRVYFVGFDRNLNLNVDQFLFPESQPSVGLQDFLIDDVFPSERQMELFYNYLNNKTNLGKYSVDDILRMEGKVIDTRMSDLRIYEGRVPTLRSQRDGIFYVKEGKLHVLTGYEALLLQGFPKMYADKVKNIVTDRHLLMQAGNAMTVSVITAIGKSMLNFIEGK